MTNNIKEQIQADLQQAKETGQLRAERIREIVKSAVSQLGSELKEGSVELRTLVKDAIGAVVESLQEKGGEVKNEVTASIEGALDAVKSKRASAIAKTEADVKQLQAKLDEEEEKAQEEVAIILSEIQATSQEKSAQTKSAIEDAINAIKNSEEVALLKKRYAQLQTQLANFASRYGGGKTEEIQGYLDQAKIWLNRNIPHTEEVITQVKDKSAEVDTKLGDAGTNVAKKERQIRQVLRELLLAAAEWFKDKDVTHTHSQKEKETVNK